MIKLVGESLKQYDLNRQVEIIPVGDVLEVKVLSKSPNALPVCFEEGFGETTVMGDTLTWDGNTEGVYNVNGMFYHVSDAVPTLEDLQNGGSFTIEMSGEISTLAFTNENVMDASTMGVGTDLIVAMVDDFGIYIALKDGATMQTGETEFSTLEKAGVYFMHFSNDDIYMINKSFTINNYTGFETTEPVPRIFACIPDILLKSSGVITVETLEMLDDGSQIEQRMTFDISKGKRPEGYVCPKPEILTPNFLKNSLPFGETTVMGDTLTWDGDMTGKPVVSLDMGDDGVMNFCKVSEVIPTIEDLGNGVSATVQGMGTQEIPAEQITAGDGYIDVMVAVIISEPNTFVENFGLTFPETGTWLMLQNEMYISEFKINNYTNFEGIKIVPVPDKYLPSDMIVNVTVGDLVGTNYQSVQVDKTYDEVCANFPNKQVFAYIGNSGMGYKIPLVALLDESGDNALLFYVNNGMIKLTVKIMPDNTCTATMQVA